MIEVLITKKQGLFTGLLAQGHASLASGSKGTNVLCAAVSTLVQTMFLYLKKEKAVTAMAKQEGVLGFQLSEVRNPKLSILVDQAFQMTIIGLEALASENREEIQVRIIEEFIEEDKRAVS
ncbi:ribosomal-processing cysteine protease Prp [Leptospira sp. GIMC2001]|uniref:ribosomal-processing cysteine protease Prp n=1 Tax=Leptospira sp. GIMC2001 TaxID=1513297 RepID=UPI00234B23FD|nr:ribosomal-processing cysteine protease Prp [Leptospira sp. GIMC2001]WCL47969.1 ribosomal-processing cysteine protease Prp [Leptospira sp. GIMC2001]